MLKTALGQGTDHGTGRQREKSDMSADRASYVSSEEQATNPSADAHAAAAEAFAERARDRFGDLLTDLYVFGSTVRDEACGPSSDVDVLVVLADNADNAAVDDAFHDLAYDVMLEYGPVVELHVLTESAFEEAREANPFVRRAVSEGRSYG